jgi:CheY-like chemotaxis protein
MACDPNNQAPRVLVVEDEYLIALEIEDLLGRLGFVTIGPVPSVAKALALMDRQRPDLALIDVNLGHERSTPVADALRARRIPYAVATGYDPAQLMERSLREAPHLSKPIMLEPLRHLLAALIRSDGTGGPRS